MREGLDRRVSILSVSFAANKTEIIQAGIRWKFLFGVCVSNPAQCYRNPPVLHLLREFWSQPGEEAFALHNRASRMPLFACLSSPSGAMAQRRKLRAMGRHLVRIFILINTYICINVQMPPL